MQKFYQDKKVFEDRIVTKCPQSNELKHQKTKFPTLQNNFSYTAFLIIYKIQY